MYFYDFGFFGPVAGQGSHNTRGSPKRSLSEPPWLVMSLSCYRLAYVRNIKTGTIVSVKTKSEAQVTIANPESFDYGEGQPVLEEFRTQVEEEVVEEVAPATNKIGNFDVVIKDNKIVSITKDGKKPSP